MIDILIAASDSCRRRSLSRLPPAPFRARASPRIPV